MEVEDHGLGCISRKEMEILEKVEGRLDGNGYINILENALIPTRDMLSMPRGWIFQQDNSTCHTSRLLNSGLTTRMSL